MDKSDAPMAMPESSIPYSDFPISSYPRYYTISDPDQNPIKVTMDGANVAHGASPQWRRLLSPEMGEKEDEISKKNYGVPPSSPTV